MVRVVPPVTVRVRVRVTVTIRVGVGVRVRVRGRVVLLVTRHPRADEALLIQAALAPQRLDPPDEVRSLACFG